MFDRTKVDLVVTATNRETGQSLRARLDGRKQATILHPESGADVARITLDDAGVPALEVFDPAVRTPSDAGKCLMQCSEECKGDPLCVVGCAALCATIII